MWGPLRNGPIVTAILAPATPENVLVRGKHEGKSMPKIALVDDDRNILTSVSMTLEAEGYHVATYTD